MTRKTNNRVAAIQMVSGTDVDANLDEAARLISTAVSAGAEFVVLPENFAIMPTKDAGQLQVMERDGDGPIQEFLSAQAHQNHVWLVGGSIPLVSSQPSKVRAACLLFNDHGERVARYDKLHLFDVKLDNGEEYSESLTIEPGESVVVVDSPLGRLGLTICYDLRFPELFRQMLDQGAEIFSVPSAFTATTGKVHWEILLRARAIENLAYVIGAGQGGSHSSGRETYGDSIVIDPWGEIINRLARGPGIVIADIDRLRLEKLRRSLPSIEHRRLGHDRSIAEGKRISA
ncbi:MAG: carbon-nitrogen hydrolase family protein [Proteobacteria bacterium]|nr:MAG: carbon-nitrogen hydrolase family protein [Pseudomonadota bacterium]